VDPKVFLVQPVQYTLWQLTILANISFDYVWDLWFFSLYARQNPRLVPDALMPHLMVVWDRLEDFTFRARIGLRGMGRLANQACQPRGSEIVVGSLRGLLMTPQHHFYVVKAWLQFGNCWVAAINLVVCQTYQPYLSVTGITSTARWQRCVAAWGSWAALVEVGGWAVLPLGAARWCSILRGRILVELNTLYGEGLLPLQRSL
jgi:hypothetical protein